MAPGLLARGGMHASSSSKMQVPLLAVALVLGCSSNHGDQPESCPSGAVCDSSTLVGAPHGVRSDGTVDVTPEEAWPGRLPEPAPVTPQELAQACVAMVACYQPTSGPQPSVDKRRELLSNCLNPGLAFFWEERAVPTTEKNERWTYEARAVVAAQGNCAAINAAGSARTKAIVCEEAGCWWQSQTRPVPTVSCAGDVATMSSAGETIVRDCARALQKCSTASPTGCTDRAPVACDPKGSDRCDGNIRLGCDHNSRVSFHDCERIQGGTCGQTGNGPACIYPNGGKCTSTDLACNGDKLTVCAFGSPLEVDCKAIGLGGCAEGVCGAL